MERGEKKKVCAEGNIKGRVDRYLSGLTKVKGDPASESGFSLGGLKKLILTWEVHYFDKGFHFYFSQSVLRKKKTPNKTDNHQVYSQSANYLITCVIYFFL